MQKLTLPLYIGRAYERSFNIVNRISILPWDVVLNIASSDYKDGS